MLREIRSRLAPSIRLEGVAPRFTYVDWSNLIIPLVLRVIPAFGAIVPVARSPGSLCRRA